ncbi:MAG: hypothetical protein IJ302_05185, partial [Clostridia bacterium]|nr:hypothetical protein [Clostridia bacterium]
ITGLHLSANGIEYTAPSPECDTGKTILGLRAQVSFLYIRNLVLRDIVILDLYSNAYGVQISNFENVLVEYIRMEGDKDGIHFGPGKNFVVRHGIFRTSDDPIALNAFDYSTSNPNPGWIEDGLIEDCRELNDDRDVGFCFFARLLCGGWQDWFPGMMVQHSDAAVHNGILYRVRMKADFSQYRSEVPPTHDRSFAAGADDIVWYRTVDNTEYTAGCRNIHFKDIYLHKDRTCAFGFTQEKSEYCRSYYPNSPSPLQENITFENVHVLGKVKMFAWVNSPLDRVTLKNCRLGDAKFVFEPVKTEGLIYPDSKIRLENTEVCEDFLEAQDAGLSVEICNI